MRRHDRDYKRCRKCGGSGYVAYVWRNDRGGL